MKRSRFSEEQIVYAIRQAESGSPVGDLCRQLGVSDATFYTWKKKYAHLGVSQLRRRKHIALHRGPAPSPTERWSMDFVHDTLADGRPFLILAVVDNWSRCSPVLEARLRMTG